jgi:hypothetical protein
MGRYLRKHSDVKKDIKEESIEFEGSRSKAHLSAYSGIFQRFRPSFFLSYFFRPDYEYCIVDENGKTIAFLDTSTLGSGGSLVNFFDKKVTVNGQSSPHKYRGNIVVKAQHITILEKKV